MSYRYGRRTIAGLPREAFRPSVIFLCTLALFIVSAVMMWLRFGAVRLDVFLFIISGWVVSLCLHEYAHALTAYKSGDSGVAERGYLTLNPLKYTHWLLSLALPLFFLIYGGIGLPGGAVWVDRTWIRSKVRDSLISVAGPGVNVLFTVLLVIPLVVTAPGYFDPHAEFWSAWAFLAWLQLTASVLNLMPVPGVDGGNALRPWLTPDWRRGFDAVAPYGMLIFLLLLWQPRVNVLFFDVVDGIGRAIGLPIDLADGGRGLFLFWR
jgi:Zn-dependent protease